MRRPFTLPFVDIGVGIFVIIVAALLLVPLPTLLLDLLLIINLTLSLLLLLVGLYLRQPLALSSFPTILLLLTLFRLGVNVASTRLILVQADAGRVIESFGQFLIRGEIVVGLVIFLIVTIVNFIVIARGSGRVSEVAARFSLDALPGQQMAIDADLRAGLISADEAHHRRGLLAKESQLFGAMDGAMKFVQGDAIAGIIITFVNIVGGIYRGLTGGMSLDDAVSTYTILTVGDGLVSQIPAILVSICAGVVVTRVSSEGTPTLGADVAKQLFSSPALIGVTAFVIAVLALLTELPTIQFLTIAGIFAGLAWFIAYRRSGGGQQFDSPLQRLLPGGSHQVLSLPSAQHEAGDNERIGIRLGMQLFESMRSQRSGWDDAWAFIRREVSRQKGLTLPEWRLERSGDSAARELKIFIGASTWGSVVFPHDTVLTFVTREALQLSGCDIIQESSHPVTGQQLFFVKNSSAAQFLARSGYGLASVPDQVAFFVASIALTHIPQLVPLTIVHRLLRDVEKTHQGLIQDAFGKTDVQLAKLTDVVHEFLMNGGSLHQFQQLLEGIARFVAGGTPLDGDVDPLEVILWLRAHQPFIFSNLRSDALVIALPIATEDLLQELKIRGGRVVGDSAVIHELKHSLHTLLQQFLLRASAIPLFAVNTELQLKLLRCFRLWGYKGIPSVSDHDASNTVIDLWRASAGSETRK